MDKNEQLQEEEVLKGIIRNTIVGICEKNIQAYPNICRYASRATIDQNNIVEKTFNYMTSEIRPMALDTALNMVDSELGGGFGD
jgi:hypothetical protein